MGSLLGANGDSPGSMAKVALATTVSVHEPAELCQSIDAVGNDVRDQTFMGRERIMRCVAASRTKPADEGDAGLPHCIDCGCCCFSSDPEYIRVFGIDLERMDARARAFTVDCNGRVAMRMAGGRCSALTIDPVARTYVCAVYEARPDVCRWLARASSVCLGDRVKKAAAPLIAVATLLAESRARA